MEVFNSEQSAQPTINFIREGAKIGLINGAIALLLMYGSYYAGLETFVTVQFVSKLIPYMMSNINTSEHNQMSINREWLLNA